MKSAREFDRILNEDKKTNWGFIYRDGIEKQLNLIASIIKDDKEKRIYYKKNPLIKLDMGTQFSKDPLLRRHIIEWLRSHGYVCFWDEIYDSYCVYLPKYTI